MRDYLIIIFREAVLSYALALPLVLALFHVIYGNGRWGLFDFGVYMKIILVIKNLQHEGISPMDYTVFSFIVEQTFAALLIWFFYRLIKLELSRRDSADAELAEGGHTGHE